MLRGQRIDGRGTDEIMRLAADEIESLQSQLSYRIEERDDSNRNLTAALRREVASKDRLAEAEALLRDVAAVVYESTGVYGFHMNGDLETWDYWPVFARIDAHLARKP
ncbi:MAG TPA: hypothetical protein VLH36_06765 [Steroidobacteraceae bacterium]|nr:hypothetical protein [Steroidobacteraceae bacterium]